jgi:hypothetical protein
MTTGPASFARDTDEGVVLSILAAPRAGRDAVAGAQGDSLRVRLAAPPVDGAANEALVAFTARVLGVPRSRVELLRGASSRRKTLLVRGFTAGQALRILGEAQLLEHEKL